MPYKWRLRRYLAEAWHFLEYGGKRLVIVWHRRAGKDELAPHWSAAAAMKRVGNAGNRIYTAPAITKTHWWRPKPVTASWLLKVRPAAIPPSSER